MPLQERMAMTLAWTVLALLWLLQTKTVGTTSAESSLGLLLFKKDAYVGIGRAVYLSQENLQFRPALRNAQGRCKVKVAINEPVTQRVGILEPHVFDCFFKPRTIRYEHRGSPLLKLDEVKFYAYYFGKNRTIEESFVLKFHVEDIPYSTITVKKPLVVRKFSGTSSQLDSSILDVLPQKGSFCKAKFSQFQSRWPSYGHIVSAQQKKPVDVLKQRCNMFLESRLVYEHSRHPFPNRDFVTILIEALFKGQVVREWVQIPVEIEPGFPNRPPKTLFTSLLKMEVTQFTLGSVSSEILSAHDEESTAEQLVFNITNIEPNSGFFVHLGDATKPIRSFRQLDINKFDIAFKPANSVINENLKVTATLVVFDGEFVPSEPITLHIIVKPSVNRNPLCLVNSALVLLEGQTQHVTKQNLLLSEDHELKIKISILGGLNHGELLVNEKPTTTLTPADLFKNDVKYRHDGSDTERDVVHFKIVDGISIAQCKLPVTIIPVDDSAPVLSINREISVEQGDVVQLSTDHLRAVDKDTELGLLLFRVTQRPTSGVVLRKPSEGDAGIVDAFLQQDLIKGFVFYQHNGQEVLEDSLELLVEDSSEPPNACRPQRLGVRVRPSQNRPPVRDPSSRLSLLVPETEVGVLSQDLLHFLCLGCQARDVRYTVTSPPHTLARGLVRDNGKVVSLGPGWSPSKDQSLPEITTFTQEDVWLGHVGYLPPRAEIGPHIMNVRFVFSVADPQGHVLTGQIFNISILPVNNQLPELRTSTLFVEEGASTLISSNELSVYDPDTVTSDLQLSLFTVPLHGQLQRDGQVMRVGDLLYLDDILRLQIEYVHDGSESFSDNVKIGLNDGTHFVSEDMAITVEPIDDERPRWLESLRTQGQLSEGGRFTISSEYLTATDTDTDDPTLTFLLTQVPKHGFLVSEGRRVTRFNQRSVHNGQVEYLHNGLEIGPNPQQDSMTFVVTDRAIPPANVSPAVHKLHMTILPVNNRPPHISLRSSVVVEESHRVTLTEEAIAVTDEDSLPEYIVCHVTRQPQFGFIQDIRPSYVFESNKDLKLNRFTALDLQQGFLVYVQANHSGIEPELDTFDIYATDSVHNSSLVTVTITITLINDEAPQVTAGNITLKEGEKHIINDRIFAVRDRDFPADNLVVMIMDPPKFGAIVHQSSALLNPSESHVETFLLSVPLEILYKRAFYKHDSSENFNDFFTLTVNDGVHSTSAVIRVNIIPVDDEKPVLLRNTGLYLSAVQEDLLLSSAELLAVDPDTQPEEVVYQLKSLPRHGAFQIWNQSISEWADISNFTQEDINLNAIRYHRTSNGSSEIDSVEFVVLDGHQSSDVSVLAVHPLDVSQAYLEVTATQLIVHAGSVVKIDRGTLLIQANNSQLDGVTLEVDQKPERGRIEHLHRPGSTIGGFTYSDVTAGLVQYNQSFAVSSQDTFDQFRLAVHSGNEKRTVSIPVIINTTSVVKPELQVLVPLHVLQSSILDVGHLQASSPDIPDDSVTFVMHGQPRFGLLLLKGKVTSNFTQTDINKGNVVYQRFGSSWDEATDEIKLMVLDGRSIVGHLNATSVIFQVILQSDTPDQTELSLGDLERFDNNQTGFLLQSSLEIVVDNNRSETVYRLTQHPQQGILVLHRTGEVLQDTFKLSDVLEDAVAYIVRNLEATNDSFTIVDNRNNEQILNFGWSVASFNQPVYYICESNGTLELDILRWGSIDQSSFVSVMAATSVPTKRALKGPLTSQVHFHPGMGARSLSILLLRDNVTSQSSQLVLSLEDPVNAVIGQLHLALVNIINSSLNGQCNTSSSFMESTEECHNWTEGRLRLEGSSLLRCEGDTWVSWQHKGHTWASIPLDVTEEDGDLRLDPTIPEVSGPSQEQSGKINNSFCARGWQPFGDWCNKWFRKLKSWSSAEASCGWEHPQGHLVAIISKEHQQWLHSIARKSFWTGMHTPPSGGKRWQYSIPIKSNYSNWKLGTRLGRPYQRCALIRNTGIWVAKDCSPRNKHTYIYFRFTRYQKPIIEASTYGGLIAAYSASS